MQLLRLLHLIQETLAGRFMIEAWLVEPWVLTDLFNGQTFIGIMRRQFNH